MVTGLPVTKLSESSVNVPVPPDNVTSPTAYRVELVELYMAYHAAVPVPVALTVAGFGNPVVGVNSTFPQSAWALSVEDGTGVLSVHVPNVTNSSTV